jgi:nitrate/nitrite transporter NarK
MWTRWIILTLNCILLVGNYYAYDIPASIKLQMEDYLEFPSSTYEYLAGLFYSSYSIPNMFFPFISSNLINIYGPSRMLIMFSLCVCMGQFLFFMGLLWKNMYLMIIARIVFGIGGESIGVIQSFITANCFWGKELAFALGLGLCIPRLGGSLNSIISPHMVVIFNKIYPNSGVLAAVLLGFILCVISLLCAISLTRLVHIKSETTSVSFRQVIARTSELPKSFWILCVLGMFWYGTVIPFNYHITEMLQIKWGKDPQTAGYLMGMPDLVSSFLVPVFGYLLDLYGKRKEILILNTCILISIHILISQTNANPVVSLVFLGFIYSSFGVTYWSCIPLVVCNDYTRLENAPESSTSLITDAENSDMLTNTNYEEDEEDPTTQDSDASSHSELTLSLPIIGNIWDGFENCESEKISVAYGVSTSVRVININLQAYNFALVIIPLIVSSVRSSCEDSLDKIYWAEITFIIQGSLAFLASLYIYKLDRSAKLW